MKQLITPEKLDNARQNLWIYRILQKTSYRKFGQQKPLTPGTIRNYELGRVPIHPKHLPIIAKRLGLPVSALTAPPDYTQILTPAIRRLVDNASRLNGAHGASLANLINSLGKARRR